MRKALVLAVMLSLGSLTPAETQTPSAGQQAFNRLKTLEGA